MKGENWQSTSSNALVQSEDGSHIEWLRRQCISGSTLDQNDYYALLGVARDASASAIKRAYFLKAREYHPDKNPGDITAKDKFQALSYAYQILSDDDLRARYDAHGVDGLDVNFIDGAELFSALFGSDKFAHLIGELKIATAVKVSGDISKIQQIQQERIDELAINLKVLLMRYTCGDMDGFKLAMTEEAIALAEAPYGTTMLSSIGQAYQTQARIFLGNAFSSGLMSLKYHGRVIKTHFKAASLAFKSYQTQQELLKLVQKSSSKQQEVPSETVPIETKGTIDPDNAKARYEIEEKALPLMLETMWAINVVDIESTLCQVCKRVLQDPTASSSELQLRANALLELGIILRSFKDKIDKSKTAREQMEDAFRRVIEKHSDQQ